MDANTRNLVLLVVLSLFCAGFAWSLEHFVLGSIFFTLSTAAAVGIAERYWG